MYKISLFFIFSFIFCLPSQAQMEIMSYNVRFANETDGENSWSRRKDYITSQLQFYEPDVMGVQEAVLEQLEDFKDHLEGYEYVGV